MVNVKQMERRMKASDLGEEGTFVEIVGSPSVEFEQGSDSPTGKLLVPVTMGGQRYTVRLGPESVDTISTVLGDETADWLHGEIYLETKSSKIGHDNVSWVVATNARKTKRQTDRLANLESDRKHSRLEA